MYEYAARVDRVVDGDTVDLTIDLGFSISYQHSCRLYGINSPEHATEAGAAAAAFLKEMLPVGTEVIIQTRKDKLEKYGRILGTLTTIPKKKKLKKGDAPPPPPETVNDLLVAAGHAFPWDGRGSRPVT